MSTNKYRVHRFDLRMTKSLHHYEDSQCQMSDAEEMTTAIIAMLYFRGNFSLASRYLYEHHYIPRMLSASRFNRGFIGLLICS